MTRAPSGLPFALQPNASPQQLKLTQQARQQQLHQREKQLNHQLQQTNTNTNPYINNINSSQVGQTGSSVSTQRYISNICRTGPVPLSRHSCTDPLCLVMYIILLIGTLVLYFLNYFSGKITTDYNINQLNFLYKTAYALNQTLPQVLFTCICLIVIGLFFLLILMLIPVIVGYLFLILSIALLAFIIYSLIVLDWVNVWTHNKTQQQMQIQSNVVKYCLVAIAGIAIVFLLILIVRRFKKLKHLGALMRVVKIVLHSNMPHLPLVLLLGLSALNIGIWVAFCKIIWNSTLMLLSTSSIFTIPPLIVFILSIILWFWTHGFMMSLSDYICQAWVIHWYYNANTDQPQQGKQSALRQNWRLSIFNKLLRYHLGTVLYGMVVTTLSGDSLIKAAKKIKQKNQNKSGFLQSVSHLSRYCYIQTIMQSFNFCMSNSQMYKLRQRIKLKIPEIYMLGHFLQQVIKIFLSMSGVFLWFILTYNANSFLDATTINFTPPTLILFLFLITLGLFLQISTNISHLFGIVSDTAVIAYSIDAEIERVHYSQNQARSVPIKLKKALRKLQIAIQQTQRASPQLQNHNNVGYLNNNMYPSISNPY